LPYDFFTGFDSASEAIEESEVDEADPRGESAGEASVVEGAESAAETVRLMAARLVACRLEEVAEDMLVESINKGES